LEIEKVMGSVLLFEMPPEINRCLCDQLTEQQIENVIGQQALADALALRAGDVEAIVVSAACDAEQRVAEQVSEVDADIAVLILCHPTNFEQVAQSLRFSVSLGPDVHPIMASPAESLPELVKEASIRTRQRRRYHNLLAAATSGTESRQAVPSNLAEEIRSSEERFRLVVEAASDPIITIEADGRIHSANSATESVFGYSPSEMIGKPIAIIMPGPIRERQAAAFSKYLISGKRSMPWGGVRFQGRRKNGTQIPLEICISEFAAGKIRVFTAVFHDLTERIAIEEEFRVDAARLKESNVSFRRVLEEELVEKEMLKRLARLMARVDSSLSLEESLDSLFDAFATVVPYERMAYVMLEDDGETVQSIWVKSMLPVTQGPVGYSSNSEGSSLKEILATGRPQIIDDLRSYLRTHPGSENTRRILAEGLRSNLTCPLIALGRSVGFIFFSSVRPNAYTSHHVEILMRIADQLAVIVERGRLWRELIEAQRSLELRNKFIQAVFGRYTSDAIARLVLSSSGGLNMGGETRTLTVLFADLRGFSQLCAELDPQRVIRLLNIHLGTMTEVIMTHEGTIDEFMGDGVLVIFGAPLFVADHASRAVACAIAMDRAMDSVRKQLSEEGLPAVEMGIAVHTGTVVAGNIGSEKRSKYGIVGAAVNLVTQIESFTGAGQILCSEDTLREAGDAACFEKGPVIEAKGTGEPVQTFAICL
jgi:PAS domain S-box-containing protein